MTPDLAALVERLNDCRHESTCQVITDRRVPCNCHKELRFLAAAAIESLAADNAALRTLLDTYNLGGWTDALSLLQRAERAEAERDALQGIINKLESECYSLRRSRRENDR